MSNTKVVLIEFLENGEAKVTHGTIPSPQATAMASDIMDSDVIFRGGSEQRMAFRSVPKRLKFFLSFFDHPGSFR
jgi:hypothetical protein